MSFHTIREETDLPFSPEEKEDRSGEKTGGKTEGERRRREPTYFTSIHLLTWPLKETFH